MLYSGLSGRRETKPSILWNSKVRGPDCFNAAGARFYQPIALMRAGRRTATDALGSPIISSDDPADGLTIYILTLSRWSDGTADSTAAR